MKDRRIFVVLAYITLAGTVWAQEMPEYPAFLDPNELLSGSEDWSVERALREARSVFLTDEHYFYTVGGLICLTEESVEVNGLVIALPAKTLHCGCVWSGETEKMLRFSGAFNNELARLISEDGK